MTSASAQLEVQPPESETPSGPPRLLTFDVEECFHIQAAARRVSRQQWDSLPSRVTDNVLRLLALLQRHDVKATFFMLGDVARRCPRLAGHIAGAGHEIACHGFSHQRLHRLTPPQLAQDVRTAKALLEDQIGRAVLGYRAPSWSLTRQTAWAVDVLAEAGFLYDASIFPVRHPAYGVPNAPLRPHWLRAGDGRRLLEVPPLVWRLGHAQMAVNVPAAGGAYFRFFPLALVRAALRQAQRQGRPAVLYFHPWEFDANQPRLPLGLLGRLRTYTGTSRAYPRLERLLARAGAWSTIAAALPVFSAMADAQIPLALAAQPDRL